MQKSWLGCVGLLTLAACVTTDNGATSKQIYLPDGNPGFTITCNGANLDWGACYDEAGKICGPAGYKKIQKSYEKGRVSTADSVYQVGGHGHSRSTHGRNMIIECGAGANVPISSTSVK